MFSEEWNKIYKTNLQLSAWPWSDLVSFVNKYRNKKNKKKISVLELGCGAGSNIPFFHQLQYDYYSVEGSSEIVNRLKKKYPKFKRKIVVGDFTKKIPFKKKFNIIIDRGSMTHNDVLAIKKSLVLVSKSLKKDGIFMGFDWFSKNDSDFNKGEKVDNFTKTNIRTGKLKNVGKIYFTDLKNLKKLFYKWKILEIYEKVYKYHKPQKNFKRASWAIVAKKK